MEADISATLKSPSKKCKAGNHHDCGDDGEGGEDYEGAINLVPAKGKKGINLDLQELVKWASAGDNVAAEFKVEKKRKIDEEGDRVIHTKIPAWSRRTNGEEGDQFIKTIKGVDKNKRKDKKLERVIINKKRMKKL